MRDERVLGKHEKYEEQDYYILEKKLSGNDEARACLYKYCCKVWR